MDYLKWVDNPPALNDPVLVVAFEGWNDAGESATSAAEYITEHLNGTVFAELDPQPFFDFTETRPTVRIGEDGREILWPFNEFSYSDRPDNNRDIIVFLGTEPQLQWRTYIEQIISVIEEYQIELVISLGALIAEVTHSRPSTVYSTSDDIALIESLDLEPSNYEGPTGIIGVLQDTLKATDSDLLSLWATIPGYVPHIPSPKAALALVQRVATIAGIDIPTSMLELNAGAYESQINELVNEDTETQGYVTELEEAYDSSMKPESGENLVKELEQFLKEREDPTGF